MGWETFVGPTSNVVLVLVDGCEVSEVPSISLTLGSCDGPYSCVETRMYDIPQSVLRCVSVELLSLPQLEILPCHHALHFRVTVFARAALAAGTLTLASKEIR